MITRTPAGPASPTWSTRRAPGPRPVGPATGPTPRWTPSSIADPATATRVFSIPGPPGTRFKGWTAGNSHHELCVTTTFEEPGDETPLEDLPTGGGLCVTYGAGGAVLGRFTAQDQTGCPDATPC